MSLKTSSKNLLVFVTLIWLFPLQSASGTQIDLSKWNRAFYNLAISSAGISEYWKITGSMPDSFGQIYGLGLLPTNLVNPFSNQPLRLDPANPGPGEFRMDRINDNEATITISLPEGKVQTQRIDSSKFSRNAIQRSDVDRRIFLYIAWAHVSLHRYFADKGVVPQSVDDLRNAGYWPFDGQLNPVSGQPLKFFSKEPGDLNFKFGYRAQACAYFTDGTFSCVSVDPESAVIPSPGNLR